MMSMLQQVDITELSKVIPGKILRVGIIAYAKIKDEIHYLLGRRYHYANKEIWTDIGGKSENKERAIKTLLREISEETDYRTANIIKSLLKHRYADIKVWRETTIKGHSYMVLIDATTYYTNMGGPTNPHSEVIEYKWLTPAELSVKSVDNFNYGLKSFLSLLKFPQSNKSNMLS